jgi:hypothetical protein
MVIYVAAKIGILQGWGIEGMSKYGTLKQFNTAMAAGAFYFCRNKSNKSAFFFLGFFAAQGLYPANQAEPRAAKSCPTAFSLIAIASANICYAPATTRGHHCSA